MVPVRKEGKKSQKKKKPTTEKRKKMAPTGQSKAEGECEDGDCEPGGPLMCAKLDFCLRPTL